MGRDFFFFQSEDQVGCLQRRELNIAPHPAPAHLPFHAGDTLGFLPAGPSSTPLSAARFGANSGTIAEAGIGRALEARPSRGGSLSTRIVMGRPGGRPKEGAFAIMTPNCHQHCLSPCQKGGEQAFTLLPCISGAGCERNQGEAERGARTEIYGHSRPPCTTE